MFIIAEIGSNLFKHDDPQLNLQMAFNQIRAAARRGANAVKFQMFTSKELFGETVESIDKYALPREWIPSLVNVCTEEKIEFMCSAFSVDGFAYIDKFVTRHKVASPEALASDIVSWCLGQDKQVIWSNGCVDIGCRPNDVVLNCVSAYPAMSMDYSFEPPHETWGISDHTLFLDVALRAKSAGATFFEKHVDFYPIVGKKTPDACVSVGSYTFKEYVDKLKHRNYAEDGGVQKIAASKYGRRWNGDGWFRPMPEGI